MALTVFLPVTRFDLCSSIFFYFYANKRRVKVFCGKLSGRSFARIYFGQIWHGVRQQVFGAFQTCFVCSLVFPDHQRRLIFDCGAEKQINWKIEVQSNVFLTSMNTIQHRSLRKSSHTLLGTGEPCSQLN